LRLAYVAAAFAILCGTAIAQDRAGQFDFYVLTLSWSPSYCAAEGARADAAQCSGERPYEFVVHGLWPQYERGYPQFCNQSAPRIPQRQIDGMLDLMPSPRLVIHQWRKHGLCADSDPKNYFATVRAARGKVAIPPEFTNLHTWRTVSPDEVERSFVKANPGLPRDGVAVTCDRRHLREVRICVTRDLDFRPCPEIDRRACRARSVAMPPSR
jgi:ribonuclease T2